MVRSCAIAPFARRCLLAAFLAGTMEASQARGQDIPDGVGVADRSHPEFRPIGGRVGSFFIYPELSAMLEFDDNVFASAAARRADTIYTLRPSATIESLWSTHSLRGTAYYQRTEFQNNDTESVSEFGGEVAGRYDIDRSSNLRLRLAARHEAERRYNFTSDQASRTPLIFDEFALQAGGTKQFGRFRVDATAAMRSLSYDDNVSRIGTRIPGAVRDSTIKSLGLRVTYVSAAAVNMFVAGQADRRNFKLAPGDADYDPILNFDRDSRGGRLEGGISIELPDRLYGSLRVGYLFQNYADPRLRDISAASYGADLLWNATRLTSLRLAIDRAVSPNTSTRDAGLFRTKYGVVISHELRRNIVLTGSAEYTQVEPIGPSPKFREGTYGVGVRYLANRWLGIEAGYVHRLRDSDDDQLDYRANRIILNVRIRL